jgi:hypothetical protein
MLASFQVINQSSGNKQKPTFLIHQISAQWV